MSILDENFAYALVSSSDRTLRITGVNIAKYHAGNANWGSFPAIPELYAGGTPAYNGYGASENAFVVVEIASGAFNGRTEFAEGPLVLPKSLLHIGDNAFKGVKITGRLTIPASVTQIGANAFDNTLIDELLVENAALTDLLSGVVDATRVTSKETDARVATDTALTGLKVTKAQPVFTGTTTIATAAVSEMKVSSHATVQTANITTGSVTNTATVDYYEPNVSDKNKNARFRVLTTAGNLLSAGGVNENLVPIEVVLTNGTYRTGAALVAALVTALNAKNIAWVGGQTISWINTSFDATTRKVKLGYSTDAPGTIVNPTIVIRTKFASNGVSYNSSSLLGAVSANIGGSDEPGAFIVTYGNRFGLSFPQAINLGTPMLNVNGEANLAGSGTVNGEWNFIGNKPRYNAEVLATESFTLSKIQAINGTSLLSTVKTLAGVASAIGADPQFAVNVQASQSSILQTVVSLASVRSTEVSSLSSALSSQVSALQSTDASLSSAISGAVPVRVSQVESVSAVLETAVSQMQSADASTSTVLSEATSVRASQTVSLNAAISTAASLLQNADTALSTSLSAATLTRSLNISANSSTWSAHVSTLQTADASLSTAIEGIAPARSSAITSLSSLVSTTVPVLESGNATFHAALSDHTVNRVASVAALSDAISAQVSTTQGLNAGLLPQITAAASVAPDATTSTVFNLLGINVNDSVTFRKTGGGGAFATGNRIVVTYSPTDYLRGTVTAVSGSDITFTVNQKATAATETTVYTTTGAFGVSTASSSGSHVVPLTTPAFVAAGSNYVITSMTGALFSSTHTNQYTVSLLDASDAVIATAPSQSFTASPDVRTHAFTSAFVLKGATNLKQKFSHAAGASTQILVNYTDLGAFTTMKGYAVDYSSGVVCIESNGALQSTRISAVGALSTSALGQVSSLATLRLSNQSGIALQTSERTASVSSIMSVTAQSVTSLQAATSAHGSAVSVAVSARNSGVSSLTSSINASVSSVSSLVTSISGAVSTQVSNRSSQVLTAVTSLVGAAPASLDTLFEIAATLDAGPTLYSTLDSTETFRETLMATSDTATNLTVSGAGTEYVINGSSKPVLTLIRGNRYTFNIGAGGHPFYFQTSGLSYNASLVYSPTGPKVRGIATQYVVVGTGVVRTGNFFANFLSQVSAGYVRYGDYRLRFSNGVISDLIITPDRAYQGTLVNPDISFALSDIPAIGVTAILQGRDNDFPANGWFDVNVPTQDITPGTTTIKFSGSSGTSYFLATPIISTATIVFDVPNDAPNTLTYVSQDKPNMGNTVNVFNNTRIKEVTSVSISLSAAVSTLQLADASLSAGISSAVSVRTSQAASVSSGVSTVISSARSTQSATSAGISSTVSLRASGVASISTALAALSSAAQLSDLSAGGSITTAISARQSGTASMSTVLSTAVSGFESVGAALSSAVSTAGSVRQSGTASVSTALSTAVSGQHQTLVSLASVQSALSAGINVSALANLSDVNSAIGAVVGVGAVTALDTLNELATAINNDATVGTTLIGLLNDRATQSEVEALGSAVLLKASQADLTQLVSTVGTKVGDASVTQLESAVTSMTVVTTSVSSQVQILQTNLAASSQTVGLLSDIIRQIDTLYEYIGSVDANGSIIYAVNKMADMVLVSSSLVFTINPTTYAVSKVAQLAVVRFDPTQTSFTYSNRGIGPIPVSLPSGTHTHTFSIDSSSATDYTNNATSIVITADPTALRTAPANSPFTVPKLALSGYTHATPTVVTPYVATTWSDATGKTSRVITVNFESGVQHLEVGGMVYAVAGTTQYVHTLEYLPGATGTLVIKAMNSATKLESASLSLSDVFTDYPQHAAPAEVGGSKTVTVSGSTYTYTATYSTAEPTGPTTFDVTASSGLYVINGSNNPTLSFVRGQRYTINVNASGHPFWIQTVPGAYSSANIYNTGVTGNGTQNGTITIDVALDAPVLYYVCQYHASMNGTINVSNASGASTVEVYDYDTQTSAYSAVATSVPVVGGQVSVSRSYLIGQAGQPLFQLRAKTGDGKRSSTFVVATAEATTFTKPVQSSVSYTTLSAGSYRATFTYTVHLLATQVRVINPSTAGTYIASQAASGGSATFSVDYTEAQGATIAVITLANSSGLQSVASDPFTPLGQYDPPVQVAGSKTVTLSSGTYTHTAQYTSASPDGINVYAADGVTLFGVGSSTGASSPFTVTVTYAADKVGQTVALLSSKGTVDNKRESEKTTSIVGEDLTNHATPVISGGITYGTSGANNTAQMNYSVTSNVDTLRVLKADQTELSAGSTSVQQSIVSTTGATRVISVTVTFTNAVAPLNIVVVAEANTYSKQSAASAAQILLGLHAAPTKATDPVYTTVSAGSYTASMTYNVVDSGVTAVQVRKASDNSVVSGVTSSINSLTATITVPFTDANSPLNIVVVALVNSVGRESLPSAQQALLKQYDAPTLQLHTLTHSGNTTSMTYSVASGVDAVEVRNAISNAVIPSTTSVNTIMGTASVSVTITENTNIVVVAVAKPGVVRESPASAQQTLLVQFTAPIKATGPVYATVSDEFYTATMTYTVASGVDAIQVRSTHNGQEWMVWNQAQGMISASTYTIIGNTATITVRVYTNNDANIFVVALTNPGVGRESAGSATQVLLPPFAKPVSVPSLRTVTRTTGFVELYNNISNPYGSISTGINLWDQPTGSKLSVTFTLNEYQPVRVIIGRYANIASYSGQFIHWALETGYNNTVRFIVNNNLSNTLDVIAGVSAGISYTVTITTDKTNNRLLFTTLNATTGQQIGTQVTRTLTSAELAQFVTTNLFARYISQYYDYSSFPLNGSISNIIITKYNEEFELSEYYLAMAYNFWGAKLRVFKTDGTQIGSDITVATTTLNIDGNSYDYFKAVVTYNASLIGQPVMKVKYIPVDGTRSESDFSDAAMGIGTFAAPIVSNVFFTTITNTIYNTIYKVHTAMLACTVDSGASSLKILKSDLTSFPTAPSMPSLFFVRDGNQWRNYLNYEYASYVAVWVADSQFYDVTAGLSNEIAKQFSYFAGYWLNANRASSGQSYAIRVDRQGTFTFTATNNYPVTTYTGSLSNYNGGQTYALTPQSDAIAAGIAVSGGVQISNTLASSGTASPIVTFVSPVVTLPMNVVVIAEGNSAKGESLPSVAQQLTNNHDAPIKAREPEYTKVSAGSYTASMSYTVPTGVTGVAVRKAPAPYNTPVSGVTYDISGNTVTIIVPFTNADAPFNVVVFALATLSPSFRESEASVEQTLAKQPEPPIYSTMSQTITDPYTASITYSVDNTFNSVSVLKSSDTSYSMYVANPTFRQPLVNFPLVGEMKVWTCTITEQLGTAALFIPSTGYLKIIFESNRVVITDTKTGYTEEITTGLHDLPRPTTFTLSEDFWTYLIQYDNNTKRKVFRNIHKRDAYVSVTQTVNSTYTGPVMINNSRTILKIAFRSTGGNDTWRVLIGDSGNVFANANYEVGWVIMISNSNHLYFEVKNFGSQFLSLQVAQNTDYVLTVIHDRFRTTSFVLTNVSTNTTVSETFAINSNVAVQLPAHGPVSVGGWIGDVSPPHNFIGTISYVTAILGWGTANVSGSSATVPVTFTNADTPLSVVAVAHSPTGMITIPSESFFLTPTPRTSPPIYVSDSITIINSVYKTTLTYTVESGVDSVQTNNPNATTSVSGTTATVVFPTEDRSISVTASSSITSYQTSAPTVFTHPFPKIHIGGYDGFVGPTISFNKTFGSAGTGNTQFIRPVGIAHAHYIYGAGNSIQPLLFVSDTENHRVQVYTSTLSNVTPPTYYATLGTGSSGTADHELNKPRQVAYCYKNKRIAITDSVNNRIVIWNVDYNQVVSFGFRTKFGSFGSGINNSQFNLPSGVAFDANGNIVVADTTNSRIKIFNSEGVHIRTWGTYGTTNGLLNYPQSVAVNAVGLIIVVCHNGVQIFTETGTFLTKISAISTFSNSFPSVAVDNTGIGKIIVTNPTTNQIHVLSNAGSLITTFGSLGSGDGQFNHPSGVTVDHSGKIYVCDRLNNRIQVLNTRSLLLDADGPTIKYIGSAADVSTTIFRFILENPRATGEEWFAVAKQEMKPRIRNFANVNSFDPLARSDLFFIPGETDHYIKFDNIVTTLMTNMQTLFEGYDRMNNTYDGVLPSPFNQPISSWDTSNVTDMSYMFAYTLQFNQPIGSWNTSRVTDISNIFYGADKFNQPIGTWNTSNVTAMYAMFDQAIVFNQPIGNWNTSNVTSMWKMFYKASLFNQPIGSWDTGAVTNMEYMFYNASSFNQNITNWNVSRVSPRPPTGFSNGSLLTTSPFS